MVNGRVNMIDHTVVVGEHGIDLIGLLVSKALIVERGGDRPGSCVKQFDGACEICDCIPGSAGLIVMFTASV